MIEAMILGNSDNLLATVKGGSQTIWGGLIRQIGVFRGQSPFRELSSLLPYTMNSTRPVKTIALVLLSLAIMCASASGADTLRTVALSGTSANFTDFGFPVINSTGQTAFRGSFNRRNGIWSEGNGSLALVALAGDAAPGTHAEFSEFNRPVLNNAGQIAFFGFLVGSGVDQSNGGGVWSGTSGSVALVARTGDKVPGTNLSVAVNSPVLNNVGQSAFLGGVTDSEVGQVYDLAIWSEQDGSLTLVARVGENAPGTSENFAALEATALNASGQLAFKGGLSAGTGIWNGRGGSLDLIAKSGNEAPGTDANFYSFGTEPVLNDAGQTAFLGIFAGARADNTYDFGIWSEGSGSLDLIAQSGDIAPGTSERFSAFLDPVINAEGKIAFEGFLPRTTGDSRVNNGVWSEGSGSLALVARTADKAPGTGAVFAYAGAPSLNGAGQTAIVGWLTGSGVDSSNDLGIWAEDRSGMLTLIAREGDLLDVDDGPGTDFRTVEGLRFVGYTGNEDGRPSAFNDRGQLAFSARFTDGTGGIFVSNLVAVPEPSSLLLALLAVAGMLLVNSRK